MTANTTPKLLSTAEIKLLNTQPIVTQNGANQLYFNPVAMADFDSVVVTRKKKAANSGAGSVEGGAGEVR